MPQESFLGLWSVELCEEDPGSSSYEPNDSVLSLCPSCDEHRLGLKPLVIGHDSEAVTGFCAHVVRSMWKRPVTNAKPLLEAYGSKNMTLLIQDTQ
ncbi:unnamed protein product [Protopolystoma xenopodis]|uniref:Uncharacterized protein n=1 Tax=Protopolystoma xenopodis TaxID=117903 RepID=A0A3S5ALT6_9PLAT|nr:unnamed protein product [Protopolystoma xenopodis]